MKGRIFIFYYTFLCFVFSFSHLTADSGSPKHCAPHDALALFQFKQHLNTSDYGSPDCSTAFPKILSWSKSKDCCEWEGVTCDMLTGYVVGLDLSCSNINGTIPPNSTLFQLHHLRKLNLAYNYFFPSPIPNGIGQLMSLTHLNLSSSHFIGNIPFEILCLSRLVSLALSWNDLQIEQEVFKRLAQNLTKLEVLSFNGVNISSKIPMVNMPTSLRHLDLSECGIYGELPKSIFQVSTLQSLSLGYNSNLSVSLPMFSSSCSTTLRVNLKSLFYLDLSATNLVGELSNSIGYMKSLTHLYLSSTKLSGQIPNSIGNLKSLTHLDLSFTKLSGKLPDSIGNLKSLTKLRLSDTNLSGKLPNSIGNLMSLTYLDFSMTYLCGELPNSIGNLTSLSTFYIHDALLSGKLPDSIGKLINIIELDLSKNNLSGEIPTNFSKFQKLTLLDFRNNNFSGMFPSSILNLSPLQFLDFSCNSLVGFLPPLVSYEPPMLEILNFSNNLLDGNIPSWLFNLPSLLLLDFSANRLVGPLPISICNMSSLIVLKLSENKLNGKIPKCLGTLGDLSFMDMEKNDFDGVLPKSLKDCRELRVLNLGRNKINDTFPVSLMELPYLQILILRSNKFHGRISPFPQKLQFPILRIFDIADNDFTGSLPKMFFESFKAVVMNDDGGQWKLDYSRFEWMSRDPYDGRWNVSYIYYVSINIMLKGRVRELKKIPRTLTAIDISCNKFEGEIPKSIGNLKGLILLNMSHNYLIGHIPLELGNLSSLEALDLSSNQLTGKIPDQLTSLTFLEILNLSQNHFVGHIPRGKQFDTFSNDSYVGNLGLCGVPLSKECRDNGAPNVLSPSEDVLDFSSGFTWRSVLIGYGCGVVFGIFIGNLMYKIGKPKWLLNFFGGNNNNGGSTRRPKRRGRRH